MRKLKIKLNLFIYLERNIILILLFIFLGNLFPDYAHPTSKKECTKLSQNRLNKGRTSWCSGSKDNSNFLSLTKEHSHLIKEIDSYLIILQECSDKGLVASSSSEFFAECKNDANQFSIHEFFFKDIEHFAYWNNKIIELIRNSKNLETLFKNFKAIGLNEICNQAPYFLKSYQHFCSLIQKQVLPVGAISLSSSLKNESSVSALNSTKKFKQPILYHGIRPSIGTGPIEAFRSIANRQDKRPNVFISRKGQGDEGAAEGDGFYTTPQYESASTYGSGFVISLQKEVNAKKNRDFTLPQDQGVTTLIHRGEHFIIVKPKSLRHKRFSDFSTQYFSLLKESIEKKEVSFINLYEEIENNWKSLLSDENIIQIHPSKLNALEFLDSFQIRYPYAFWSAIIDVLPPSLAERFINKCFQDVKNKIEFSCLENFTQYTLTRQKWKKEAKWKDWTEKSISLGIKNPTDILISSETWSHFLLDPNLAKSNGFLNFKSSLRKKIYKLYLINKDDLAESSQLVIEDFNNFISSETFQKCKSSFMKKTVNNFTLN